MWQVHYHVTFFGAYLQILSTVCEWSQHSRVYYSSHIVSQQYTSKIRGNGTLTCRPMHALWTCENWHASTACIVLWNVWYQGRIFLNTIFVSSHMYPENPKGTQVIVSSMNMGYISDTARNRTHNLFRTKQEPIPLGHSDGRPLSTIQAGDVPDIRYYSVSGQESGVRLDLVK